MAEHTPGPWKVFTTKDGTQVIGIGELNGAGVADCGFGVWRGGSKEALANARLIAAAPETAAERDRLREVNAELLAILKRILSAHQTGNNGAINGEATLCRHFEAAAEDAIAKAEGKS